MTFWQKNTILQMKHSTFAVWKRLMLRMYALKGQ